MVVLGEGSRRIELTNGVCSNFNGLRFQALNPARNWRLQDSDEERLLFGEADKIAVETGGSRRHTALMGPFAQFCTRKSRYSQVTMKEWRDKKEILKSVKRTSGWRCELWRRTPISNCASAEFGCRHPTHRQSLVFQLSVRTVSKICRETIWRLSLSPRRKMACTESECLLDLILQ